MTAVETEQTTLEKGFIGQSVPRKEDRRLVQGQGVFFDDIKRQLQQQGLNPGIPTP